LKTQRPDLQGQNFPVKEKRSSPVIWGGISKNGENTQGDQKKIVVKGG